MLICKLHRGARAPNIVDAVWSALPSSALVDPRRFARGLEKLFTALAR